VRVAAIALVTIAGVSVASGLAHADDTKDEDKPDPEPAADRAGDANLESIEHRRGVVFSAALGPSLTFHGNTGTGGTFTLKVGHVATPRATFTFLIGGGAQPHRVGTDGDLVANNVTYALAGAQYWFTGSVWVSVGGGGGTFHCNQCIDKETMIPKDTKHAGLASGAGAGVDLVRFKGMVLGLEIYSILVWPKDDKLVLSGGSAVSIAFD
jgi:hypothetical protein